MKKDKETSSDDILEKAKKHTGKKRIPLANGGVVFDLEKLSPDQKEKYLSLDTNAQTQWQIDNGYIGSKSADLSSSPESATLSSAAGGGSSVASGITGIIGAVTGIAEAAGGDTDKYGAHGSDIQTYSSRSSDIGGNISTGFEEIKDGDIIGGLGNILQLGGAMNASEDREVEEAKAAEKKKENEESYARYQAQRKFANGGSVEDEDLLSKLVAKIPTINTDAQTTKFQDIPSKNVNGTELPGYVEVPTGRNYNTGKMEYEVRQTKEGNTANITRNGGFDKSDPEIRALIIEAGGDPVEFDTQEKTAKFLNENYNSKGREFGVSASRSDKKKLAVKEYILDKNTTQELSEGGEVVGKGTGKSDSINASIPEGSFIVPADANENAVNRLKKYMGYDNADVKSESGVDVKLSDGELYIPPQDVAKANAFISDLGYENGLNSLAPNAKTKLQSGQGYVDGLSSWAGGAAGAGQLAYGLYEGLFGNNEEPKSMVPDMLRDLSTDVRKRASYGMNPYERTQAENEIAKNFQIEKELIREASGGSLDVYMNNAVSSASRTNASRMNLEVASSKMKESKDIYADSIYMKYIDSNEQKFNREYDKYLQNESAISEMIGAGISNIVGQAESNKYADALENAGLSLQERNQLAKAKQEQKNTSKNTVNNALNEKTDFWRRNGTDLIASMGESRSISLPQ